MSISPAEKKVPKCFIVPTMRDRERDRERDGERDREWNVLPPSIFFIFKYDNKQLALVLKMCL